MKGLWTIEDGSNSFEDNEDGGPTDMNFISDLSEIQQNEDPCRALESKASESITHERILTNKDSQKNTSKSVLDGGSKSSAKNMTTNGISNQENKDKEGTKQGKQSCKRKLFNEKNDLQCDIPISNDGGNTEAMTSDLPIAGISRAAGGGKKKTPFKTLTSLFSFSF